MVCGVRALTFLLLLLALGAAGCGAYDDAKDKANKAAADVRDKANKAATDVRDKAREVGKDIGRLRDRVQAKVNDALARIKRVLPRADEDTPVPTLALANSFDGFLDDVLGNVDRYWARTLTAADLPAPKVKHRWIAPGSVVQTGCNDVADDQAAFYCPLDDTIYIGRSIARDVLENVGDFGVAYIVAHEYAHNIQSELGWFDEGLKVATVAPFELQADCMAGAWGWAVYEEGNLQPGDVEEAVQTALAVGDFDFNNPQHHGTPDERRDAWLKGYASGDASTCRQFTTG
jgi:predicted metalloprotease